MAKGTGVPCGATHISAAYICRVDSAGPKSEAKIAELQETLNAMPSGAAEQWGGVINISLNGSLRAVHSDGSPYTPEEFDEQMIGRTNGWIKMVRDGPPSQLLMRDGSVVPAPAGMTPDVSNTGQRFWIHPDNGLKYSAPSFESKKDGGAIKPARQNRVSKMDSARRAEDMVSFKRTAKEQGTAWPAQELPASGKPLNATKIKAGLSENEKNAIRLNGLDWTHGEGRMLHEYYAKNPKEGEKRLNDVIARYAAQDGRSGVSGKPIALPGLAPKAGQEKSSVDHFIPISTGRGQDAKSLRQNLDKRENFLLTEEGFNSQRGNRNWGGYADKWAKELQKEGGITTRSGPGAWGGATASAGRTSPAPATRSNRPAPAAPTPKKTPKKEAKTEPTPVRTGKSQTKIDLQRAIKKARRDGRDDDLLKLERRLRKM